MNVIKMEVSKKVDGKFNKVGDVEVFVPSLNDLGINAEASGTDEAGLPTYAVPSVQFVMDAVAAAVKAMARNKLQPQSVELKEGCSIAKTVEELLAPAERTGEALQVRREFFAELKSYLPTLGKSAAYCAQLYDIIYNVKGISAQSEARKQLISQTVAGLVLTFDDETLARYSRVVAGINEQLEAESELPE